MSLTESEDSASTCLSAASCAAIEFSQSLPNQKGHAGRQWLRVILPKQKGSASRPKPGKHSIPIYPLPTSFAYHFYSIMKTSSPPFEFQYSLTIQDFWEFQQLLTKRIHTPPLGPRLKNILFWIFLCFFLIIILGGRWQDLVLETPVLVGLVTGLCAFVMFAKYIESSTTKACTPMPHGIILSERKLLVTEAGVTQKWDEAEGSISWAFIEEIYECPTVILLRVDSFLGIPIPNQVFSTETEKKEFLSSIREFWKQQHSQQKV